MTTKFGNRTITITFGDQAENHVGMQKIGKMAESGFNYEELAKAKELFEKQDYKCELIDLRFPEDGNDYPPAYILIVRNGVNALLADSKKNNDDLFKEHVGLKWDKKALMYGKVVNKKARFNLCFGEKNQEPDYENGKGRIVSFTDIPITNMIRERLPFYFGDKAKDLFAEGNSYGKDGGISFHGDSERKKVLAVRLGEKMKLVYRWYCRSEAISKKIEFVLNHGDLYVMCEKATGNDWKKKNIYTLRHATGCQKFLTIK